KMQKPPSKEQDSFAVNESDCCGNGCTNCILDNRPKPSTRLLLAGKRNVILGYTKFRLVSRKTDPGDGQVLHLHLRHSEMQEKEMEKEKDKKKEDDSVLDIPPGHHVMLRMGDLLRPYSPHWSDFQLKEFRILVKLRSGGEMSKKLCSLQPGALLEFRGPVGNYQNEAGTAKCLFIIAQGVAVAPTLPLVRQVLDDEDDMSRIWHLVCARDLQHAYLREEMLEFARYWNYRSCLYVPHQTCELPACRTAGRCAKDCRNLAKCQRYLENIRTARLDEKELAGHANTNIPGKRVLIIAGDANFQKNIKELASKTLNVDPPNVYLL
ncbi:hypothetical protein KR018_003484, partial [Drosophila ironensis]